MPYPIRPDSEFDSAFEGVDRLANALMLIHAAARRMESRGEDVAAINRAVGQALDEARRINDCLLEAKAKTSRRF